MIPGIKSDKVEVFNASLRAIFLLMLHKYEIGEDFSKKL